ncbi:hypothetical protein GCM10009865_22530 [Aeromicrobium ponti]
MVYVEYKAPQALVEYKAPQVLVELQAHADPKGYLELRALAQ